MSRVVVKSQINIYTKQKKDDIVDVIFSEVAALDLSDMISDFIADSFNHLHTSFTVSQLRTVCGKVKQLSTNALANLTLSKLKNSSSRTEIFMNFFG
jgi:predicted DNA-binding protein with PD1-like motif